MSASGEVFETLYQRRGVRIERILSKGHKTPDGEWLCERTSEWVIVLKGRAKLRFKKGDKRLFMKEGDFVFIPAKTPHRVDWTDPKRKTVWLALHAL